MFLVKSRNGANARYYETIVRTNHPSTLVVHRKKKKKKLIYFCFLPAASTVRRTRPFVFPSNASSSPKYKIFFDREFVRRRFAVFSLRSNFDGITSLNGYNGVNSPSSIVHFVCRSACSSVRKTRVNRPGTYRRRGTF